ncbi:glycosyltransferase [Leptospira levettii]|uniref:Glycosyltransferase n=1 Tax=Leptospira levettii TaxID=2023178 RepID=A0A6H3NL75_9LEPT|nr:glycosyltransferase family 2 protein [Leptospira levettii]MCW7466237.1 glycosyltransferase [Leptospira levettii]MCW7512238.1 glycosyltransferase [Leptospira levettii]MCW7516246.1 glycosyltransferase [Leptospira levettii]TGM78919.1 glycosyltransferase [Leptospira levettii]
MAQPNPKLSIITIVLNNHSFLKHTIESVIKQSYSNIEYIVIDGGSTDGSVELIQSYGSKIKTWISEKDSGIYNAINKGVSLATGEWLCILNAGDRLANENTITQLFREPISNEIQVLYGDWFLCNLKENPNVLVKGHANLAKGYILHQSLVYRTSLHKLRGPYLETKKLIISDYIFLRSIDEKYFQFVNMPISINDNSGVSSQSWSLEQKVAYDFILGNVTFQYMVKRILFERMPGLIKRILQLLLKFRSR